MFFKLVVQGLREIGVSSVETLCSGHFMYTIGHTYFPKSLDNQQYSGFQVG